MATYKKRSRKNISKSNSNANLSSTKQVFETLDESASKTEIFVNKYQKYLSGAVLVLVLIFVLYFSYSKLFFEPNIENNSDSLYKLSLEGAEGKFGFLDIIDNYKGTPAANISYYYSGIAYFNLEKYDLAIKYLNDFQSNDEILSSLALSTIGDSFIQLNQLNDGLDYFEKALSKANDNSFIMPLILMKAGDLSLFLGKKSKANKYFNQIKDDFPKSQQADIIEMKISETE